MKCFIQELGLKGRILNSTYEGNETRDIKLGPPEFPRETIITKMKGGCKHYKLSIDLQKKAVFVIHSRDVSTKVEEFLKHKGLLGSKRTFYTLLEEANIDVERIADKSKFEVELVQGVTLLSSEESGVGKHSIHANMNFNGKGVSRHDFIEANVEFETLSGVRCESLQLAQVILFLQISRLKKKQENVVQITSRSDDVKLFALLQWMVSEHVDQGESKSSTNKASKVAVGNDKIVKHKSVFQKFKWEYTTYGAKTFQALISVSLIPVSSLSSVVYIAPDFSSMQEKGTRHGGLRTDYKEVASRTDRYWYVPRRFTDRSGWNLETEADAFFQQNDIDDPSLNFDDRLMKLMEANIIFRNENMGVGRVGEYDVGEVMDELVQANEEVFDDDLDINIYQGMLRARRGGVGLDAEVGGSGQDDDDVW
jgi:hypothetical protein